MKNYVKMNLINVDNYVLALYMLNCNGAYGYKAELYNNSIIVDSALAQGITDDADTADSIYRKIVKNKVFPAHLYYVIDECI